MVNKRDTQYLLLTPGPLSTTRTVREAMMQEYSTWDVDYNGIVQSIRSRLVRLAVRDDANLDAHTAVLMQGSGTFAVESVVGSVIPPDGKLLAMTGFHETLLHKADGSGLVARLIGMSERIESVRFSPDGKQLLSGEENGVICEGLINSFVHEASPIPTCPNTHLTPDWFEISTSQENSSRSLLTFLFRVAFICNRSPGNTGCLNEYSAHPSSSQPSPNASSITSVAHPHTVTPPTKGPSKP